MEANIYLSNPCITPANQVDPTRETTGLEGRMEEEWKHGASCARVCVLCVGTWTTKGSLRKGGRSKLLYRACFRHMV